MTPTSLADAVVCCTSKIIKNGLRIFENGILHFVFKLSQSSKIGLQS